MRRTMYMSDKGKSPEPFAPRLFNPYGPAPEDGSTPTSARGHGHGPLGSLGSLSGSVSASRSDSLSLSASRSRSDSYGTARNSKPSGPPLKLPNASGKYLVCPPQESDHFSGPAGKVNHVRAGPGPSRSQMPPRALMIGTPTRPGPQLYRPVPVESPDGLKSDKVVCCPLDFGYPGVAIQKLHWHLNECRDVMGYPFDADGHLIGTPIAPEERDAPPTDPHASFVGPNGIVKEPAPARDPSDPKVGYLWGPPPDRGEVKYHYPTEYGYMYNPKTDGPHISAPEQARSGYPINSILKESANANKIADDKRLALAQNTSNYNWNPAYLVRAPRPNINALNMPYIER
eukprot:tig00000215_g18657.t1